MVWKDPALFLIFTHSWIICSLIRIVSLLKRCKIVVAIALFDQWCPLGSFTFWKRAWFRTASSAFLRPVATLE